MDLVCFWTNKYMSTSAINGNDSNNFQFCSTPSGNRTFLFTNKCLVGSNVHVDHPHTNSCLVDVRNIDTFTVTTDDAFLFYQDDGIDILHQYTTL